MTKKNLIFAELDKGKYRAQEIINNINIDFYNLEYGDVFEERYQVWEYPSGKIFSIIVDRKLLEEKNYRSTPDKNLWLPKLKYLKKDEKKVRDAYKFFYSDSEKRSILSKIFKTLVKTNKKFS